MQSLYACSLIGFFALMFLVAFWAARKVHNVEDFIVAGRGLTRSVLIGTLIATWFGAGSLTVSANAVAEQGLRITALEPFGVGFCLILAGLFYARRLWQAKVLTLADLMRRYFGATAEKLQIAYSVSYFGWIAVQLMAIGNIFELVFGLDAAYAIVLVTIILTLYTLLGGMWSVALTDAVQIGVLIIGLILLTAKVLLALGDGSLLAGVDHLFTNITPAQQIWIPTESLEAFNYWLGLFLVGALGNLATQDFLQRIFSAKSPQVAVSACISSGIIYIIIAMMPVLLGMAGSLLLEPGQLDSVVPALTREFLSPGMSVLFILTLTAAITSTVDSAMLGPASTFAQNMLRYMFSERVSTLTLTRYCVLFVAMCSAGLALSGTSAIDLLQSSYTLGIPPLVILSFGLYQKTTYPLPAIVTGILGLLVWGYDMLKLLFPAVFSFTLETSYLPLPLLMLILSIATYLATHHIVARLDNGSFGISHKRALS